MKGIGLAVAGGLALGAVAVLLGAGRTGGKREGVAPWDVPDGPNPYPTAPAGAPVVPDPKGMVRAGGTKGTTDNGYTVEIVSVGRRGMNPMDETLPDARPVWSPDGSPYDGKPLTMPVDGGAQALEDKGARYLTLKLGGPMGRMVDVMGYVPEGAREGTPKPEFHGWFLPRWTSVSRFGDLRVCVAVDDRSASHFRFAVADGEWKTVATGKVDPKRRDAYTVLRGSWGTLRHLAPRPRPFATSKWTLEDEYGRYVVEAPSLAPSDELRFQVVDTKGKPAMAYGPGAAQVRIESRPWHWVELSGVHYDPDPKKWGKAMYWGAEGEAAVSKADGASLIGLVRPVRGEYGQWSPGAVYAPDGRLWRNHPDAQAIRPTFSGGEFPKDALVAALRLDESRVSDATPAWIEGFAADSATPGEGLAEPLSPWPRSEARRGTAQVLFARPARPYVQFAIRYGSDDWTKAGEIPAPRLQFPLVPPAQRADYDSGRTMRTVYTVCLRGRGRADAYYQTRDETSTMREGLATWPKDAEARVVARLKSGRRVVLKPNSVGISEPNKEVSRDVGFELIGNSDAVYDAARHDAVDKTRVLFSEVAAFEIETRGFGKPAYVVAKLP